MTEALYSGILKTNYTPDLLPEDVTAPPVIQRYLNENYDIIIGTSVGFGQLLLEAAQAHPEKKFASVFAVLVSNQSNLAMLNPYLHQAFFLTGVVAGGTSEGPFCYLGSMEIPEVFQMINAYALGVRVFRPNATIELVYSGTWADPPLEDEIARYMLARGCKVSVWERNLLEKNITNGSKKTTTTKNKQRRSSRLTRTRVLARKCSSKRGFRLLGVGPTWAGILAVSCYLHPPRSAGHVASVLSSRQL